MCKLCIDRYLPKSNRAVGFTKKYWQNGQTLNIRFLQGTEEQQDFVWNACLEWMNYANINFKRITEGESHIRVAFDKNDGSWSYIGKDALSERIDQPTMNFGWLDTGVVLHEFGHALGLGHEHQNPQGSIQWNEAAVIEDLSGSPNYWDLGTIRFNVLNRYSKDVTNGTQVDPDSIMMYYFPKSWTLNGFEGKRNQQLSATDKAFIAATYPKQQTPVVDPKLDFIRAIFITPGDIIKQDEKMIVRIGQYLGIPTDEKGYPKRVNTEMVLKVVFP
jgi:hypothetical protein